MAMNIKNAETERAVRQLAEATGESLTQAITVAVRERLARIERDPGSAALVDRLVEIGRRNRERIPEGFRGVDPTDDLYDDFGLPA